MVKGALPEVGGVVHLLRNNRRTRCGIRIAPSWYRGFEVRTWDLMCKKCKQRSGE